ncbi:MAG: endonuclease, partial [Bacteroidota bacterium]
IDGADSFKNFIDDTENYIFADFPINEGSSADFSYPSWPSHLDHILLTNELCDNLVSSYTIRLDDCVSGYFSQVSDHRPVMVTLKADE